MIRLNRPAQTLMWVLSIGVIALLLWADPYTHGRIGGEFVVFTPKFEEVPLRSWQIGASLLLALLLTTALVAGLLRAWSIAVFSLSAETVTFTVLNVAYIVRDGWITRGTVGDEGAMNPGLVTVLALGLRISVLLLSRNFSEKRHRYRSPLEK
jgi:hypothetical protein